MEEDIDEFTLRALLCDEQETEGGGVTVSEADAVVTLTTPDSGEQTAVLPDDAAALVEGHLSDHYLSFVSIDVGVRHLAVVCAILCFLTGRITIRDWDLVDVTEGDAAYAHANLNAVSIEDVVPLFVRGVTPHLARWVHGAHVLYIETQPLGQRAHNVRTKVLSHILQALFIQAGIPRVAFVSPQLKSRAMTTCAPPPHPAVMDDAWADGNTDAPASADLSTYAARKRAAVVAAEHLLQEHAPEWAACFARIPGKRDDVADALLQGVESARKEMAAYAMRCAKAARAAAKAADAAAKLARKEERAAAKGKGKSSVATPPAAAAVPRLPPQKAASKSGMAGKKRKRVQPPAIAGGLDAGLTHTTLASASTRCDVGSSEQAAAIPAPAKVGEKRKRAAQQLPPPALVPAPKRVCGELSPHVIDIDV